MKLVTPIKIFFKGTDVQLRVNSFEDLGVDGIKYSFFNGNPMVEIFCKNDPSHLVFGAVNIPNKGPRLKKLHFIKGNLG
jgi:hypothetical protein